MPKKTERDKKDYPLPPKRTPEEIQAEYLQVCAELGDLVYRRDTGIPKRITELQVKAEALNIENAAAMAAHKESKDG